MISIGMTNNELLRRLDYNYRMPKPDKCPDPLYEIMLKTWHNDPIKRPTFLALQSMLEEILFSNGNNYREAHEIN